MLSEVREGLFQNAKVLIRSYAYKDRLRELRLTLTAYARETSQMLRRRRLEVAQVGGALWRLTDG